MEIVIKCILLGGGIGGGIAILLANLFQKYANKNRVSPEWQIIVGGIIGCGFTLAGIYMANYIVWIRKI